MSGTSSIPEREAQSQPVDPRTSEEIGRLKIELERVHIWEARLREDVEARRIYAQ